MHLRYVVSYVLMFIKVFRSVARFAFEGYHTAYCGLNIRSSFPHSTRLIILES